MLKAVNTNSNQFNTRVEAQSNESAASSRAVYDALLHEYDRGNRRIDESTHAASRAYLRRQLAAADKLACDLPDDVRSLPSWSDHSTAETGRRYRQYLSTRKLGGTRQYFSSKSHALYFLKAVAPTKLVDGAWLYGLLQHWNDARFAFLIRIYLEELGEGLPDKNHVVLYQKLLTSHGCEQWKNQPDHHYVQGAIQLSLAHHAAEFLPEVIGFNLGYEQLPLHLLITAYELNELGIDPYYFTLHVTIDNAATGHAQKSVQAVVDAMPHVADQDAFYRRVINGYKLNMLGSGTVSIIESFDLEQELLSILAAKAVTGSQLHSDYCRVAGKTVNDWLSEPGQLPAFLAGLEKMGWIKRHQDPENSRFWKLIHGERAEMFGVFTAYEQQLIHDWIAGEPAESASKSRQLSFRNKQRLLAVGSGERQFVGNRGPDSRGVIRAHSPGNRTDDAQNDFNADLRLLEQKLASLATKEEVMAMLTGLMSPAKHHTASGLMATRIFTRLYG